jgi:phosphohistidine phosphatase
VKRLTLMRHGDAQWKDPEVADFARPLNRRGNNEAEAIARRLSELQLIPDLIITSPARRAAQTAETVARELNLPPRSLQYEEGLYLAGAEEILKLVRGIGPLVPHLMIVCHNPGISEVANILAPSPEMNGLSTAAFCSITFDASLWPQIGPKVMRDSVIETPPTRLFSLFA